MKKYTKPEINKVNIKPTEQVLSYCKQNSYHNNYCYRQSTIEGLTPAREAYIS